MAESNVAETTALQNVNMAMLDRAVEEGSGSESVLSVLDSVKVYNPAPNTPAEPDKAGKIKIKLAGTVDAGGDKEVYIDGPLTFTPLSIVFTISGSIYPRLENGELSADEYFFYTSEFHKFTKRTDTIGLACKGKPIGFYTKAEFEQMLKTPMLNGMKNQFYKEKEDINHKPYDSSRLDKKAIIYGIITEGEYKGNMFRMFINPSVFGITYDRESGQNISAEPGTIEYAIEQALPELNKILQANGRKPVKKIDHSQVDMKLTVVTNEKGNFLPHFEYAGLVAMRGVDNSEEVKYIHDLREEHFRSIFGEMGIPTPISIAGWVATGTFLPPPSGGSAPRQLSQWEAQIVAADEAFGPDTPDF